MAKTPARSDAVVPKPGHHPAAGSGHLARDVGGNANADDVTEAIIKALTITLAAV